MKAIRASAASSTLLLASILAHILAGGGSLSLHSGLSIVLLSIGIATILNRHSGDPIVVTLAIFVAQNASHFILGGHADSELQMVVSHLCAGLLSYHLLRFFDHTLPSLGQVFLSLLIAAIPHFRSLSRFTIPGQGSEYRFAINNFLSSAYSLRGPPLL